jgi:hypothetical protein
MTTKLTFWAIASEGFSQAMLVQNLSTQAWNHPVESISNDSNGVRIDQI